MKLKLRSVGTSTGLVLPKEMLVRLRAKKDDTLFAIETPVGYLLTPYAPEVEKQLDLGRGFMGPVSKRVPRAGQVRKPLWLDQRALVLLHAESLAEHAVDWRWGLRDEAALQLAAGASKERPRL